MGGREAERIVRATWAEVREKKVTFMAGSIAYHAFVSMFPLLVVLLFVVSAVDDATLTARLSALTAGVLTPHARELLVASLGDAQGRAGVSIAGGITLLWATSKVFRGLDVAFSEIYDSEGTKSLLGRFRNALIVLFALAVAVVVFVLAGTAVAVAPDLPYPAALNPALLVAGLAVAFVPVYYVFPDVDLTLREVLPGVVVAAVGWAVLEAAFQAYVTSVGQYAAVYGALGSVLLLLIWLYFGGLVVLVGAVLNAVLAGRTGDEHALDVTDEDSAAGPIETRDTRTDRPGTGDSGAGGFPDARRPPGTHAGPVHVGVDRPRPDAERDRLASAVERLAAENEWLERENERLRRENEALARRLRRRSVRARLRRWVFGGRE